ncbi:peptidoglycan DD-metalloendopeptidase family protein [Zavarzinia sp. CC-PAN008]|uniref:M23 family metallopeptidase n=1 Tax=Zavarzinia sp. CC-PAN008 TaxID=3243332 RepID=UPI003F7499F0
MRIAHVLLVVLMAMACATAPARAESGGGSLAIDTHDHASAQIQAIHASVVRSAATLGAPVGTMTSQAVAATRFQYPLQFTPTAQGFEGEGISGHVDLDPGPKVRDFNCGTRTYNGHTGTDFVLWPYGWNTMDRMAARVVAAMGGVIVQKRDGEYDRQCSSATSAAANYVVIRHDNGLLGYYWHLKRGSVTTKAIGARVALGEAIGFVGSSGQSSGPHLHFEVRNAAGAVIDPYAGACNPGASRWTHQSRPADPAILRIATHSAAPPSTQDRCANPAPHYANRFNPGATMYAVVYLRDQVPGYVVSVAVVRPNGTIASTWQTGSPASGVSPLQYWYASYLIPAGAPAGEWRIRATAAGRTMEQTFWVGAGMPSNTTIAATALASPVRTVKAGASAAFDITLKNTTGSTAIGCRLSLGRPINGVVDFHALATTGLPVAGGLNRAFTIPALGSVTARILVTPRVGFSADAAEFPVLAKCTNSNTAAFSRTTTLLTLTGG